MLPLFKCKGGKENNRDNYRGITIISKIYEMTLVNRLEKYASQNGYFFQIHFGFQEGARCIEASFTILETVNYVLERG